MDSVEILMSVSAPSWHGKRMSMIGGTGQQPGGAWAGGSLALVSVFVMCVPLAILHVVGIGLVDPVRDPISDYALVPGGYALLAFAAFALAAATTLLSAGLRTSGLPSPARPAGLLLSGSAALVVVAVFPTHAPGTTAGIISNIHRVAGGWVFVALPLACWMVASRAREVDRWKAMAPALSWSSGISGILAAGFLLSYVPIVVAGSPGIPPLGGVERVLYAAVMVGLLATVRATRLAVDAAPVGSDRAAASSPTGLGHAI